MIKPNRIYSRFLVNMLNMFRATNQSAKKLHLQVVQTAPVSTDLGDNSKDRELDPCKSTKPNDL